jgi:uncharacterized protein YcaQ
MPAVTRRLSADAARRIAIAAQGLTRPRPTGRVTRRHLRRVFDDIGLVQIDSVNVLVRSHELPLFARLGPHPRTLIGDAVAAGELFEYWAHVASYVPTKHLPLWRWRMEELADGPWANHFTQRHPGMAERILEQVRVVGPIAVGDVEGRVRKPGTWWSWDDAKVALETLFARGAVSVTRRRSDFARLYDLIERIVPPDVLAAPPVPEPDARRRLLLLAARSLGVATVADLCDYYRLSAVTSKSVIAELVAEGLLLPVEVDGWDKPALLHPEAATPRRVTGRALLSPFDSLVWFRERTERLFDFNYRIEIYTPKPKRIYGYYVLPFLLDGHLVGRVDLKADRAAGVLRAQASWIEDDLDNRIDRPPVAEQLALELAEMAGWLGLRNGVVAAARGNLAKDLLDAPNVMPIVESDA